MTWQRLSGWIGTVGSRVRRPVASLRPAVALVLIAAVVAFGWRDRPATNAASGAATPATADEVAALTELVSRSGFTGDGIEVEIILATPEFFRLTDRWPDALDLGADRVVVFVFNISHHGALDDDETIVPILQLDGRRFYVPSEVRPLADDGHHRSDALIFGDLPVSTLDESHTLDLLLPPAADGTRPTFRWATPLDEPAATHASQAATPASQDLPTWASTELAVGLTRSGRTGVGTDVDVTLAPPELFRLIDRWADAVELGADRATVFLASEHHYHGAEPLAPVLRVDGEREYRPTEVRVLSEDGHHHRSSILIFAEVPATELDNAHVLELLLPPTAEGDQDVLVWSTPIEDAVGTPAPAARVETVDIALDEFAIRASRTHFRIGQPYRFIVTNVGRLPHEFMIVPAVPPVPGDAGGHTHEDGDASGTHAAALAVIGEEDLPPGASRSIDLTFTESAPSGTLEFACYLDGHYEAGMALPLTVA